MVGAGPLPVSPSRPVPRPETPIGHLLPPAGGPPLLGTALAIAQEGHFTRAPRLTSPAPGRSGGRASPSCTSAFGAGGSACRSRHTGPASAPPACRPDR